MPGNAVDLGSLYVALELRTADFNRQLGHIQSSVHGAFGNIQAAARSAAMAFGAAFAGGVAATYVVVDAAKDLDAAMNRIESVSGATAAQIADVQAVASRLGQTTYFSAIQVAQGIEELIRGGTSIKDVLDGAADAAIMLAAAGRIDLASAADVATDAMQAFGLAASDLPKVADLFAGAANRSSTTVEQLTFAFRQAAPVAATMRLPLRDLIDAFGVLSNRAIKGSDAGTSLRVMLLRLSPETDKAADLMKRLGIITEASGNAFFTAEGNLRGIADIAGVLQTAFRGWSTKERVDAMSTMFGQDAIRAASALFEAGTEGIRAFDRELEGVTAADVARIQMQGLSGSLEQLRGSIETMLAEFGEPLLRPITFIVDQLKRIVEFAGELPDWAQTLLTFLMGGMTVVAGAGLVAALTLMTVPSIVGGISIVATGVKALGAGIASFAGLETLFAVLSGPVGLIALAAGVTAVVGAATFKALTDTGAGLKDVAAGIGELGSATRAELTAQLVKTADEIERLEKALRRAVPGSGEAQAIQAQLTLLRERLQKTFEALNEAKPKIVQAAATIGDESKTALIGTDAVPRGIPAASHHIERVLRDELPAGIRASQPSILIAADALGAALGDPMVASRRDIDAVIDAMPGISRSAKDTAEISEAALAELSGNIEYTMSTVAREEPAFDASMDRVSISFDELGNRIASAVAPPAVLADAAEWNVYWDIILRDTPSRFVRAVEAGVESLKTSMLRAGGILDTMFRVDIPGAFGEGFGGVLALQDTFKEGWTRFTEALKTVWSDALGDMVANFVRGFTAPIGRELGELFARASGIAGLRPDTAATAGTAANALTGATGTGRGAEAARTIGTVIGYAIGVEAVAQGLGALGFTNVPSPSRLIGAAVQAFTGGAAGLRLTGKRIPNDRIPEAAWRAVNSEAFKRTRSALFADTLDWALAETFAERRVKSIHPESRTGGVLRGVYVTTMGIGAVLPTDIGMQLLLNRGLTPAELGVDERWLQVGSGNAVALIAPDGTFMGFQEIEPDYAALAEASGVPTNRVEEFTGLVRSGMTPNAAAMQIASTVGGTTAALGPGTTATLGPASELAAAAQAFAQGVAFNIAELERDTGGRGGILDIPQQISLTRGLAKVANFLANTAASAGIALGSIPIPGGMTFGELFPGFSGTSYNPSPSALISVNVDKFFGSESELRSLTTEIVRIARQEGLVVNPIVA